MNQNRAVALLAPLIVLLLAVGGFLLLRADDGPSLGGDGGADVADGPTATPSEIATDAMTGGADGATETPSPTPSEIGGDAAAGGGAGAGAVGGDDSGDTTGDEEDPTVDEGDDGTAGAGGEGTGDDGTDAGTGDDDSREVAGDVADTDDADADGALPETGSAGMLAGLVLMLLGVSLRPRR
jgi:hypothetical protein